MGSNTHHIQKHLMQKLKEGEKACDQRLPVVVVGQSSFVEVEEWQTQEKEAAQARMQP